MKSLKRWVLAGAGTAVALLAAGGALAATLTSLAVQVSPNDPGSSRKPTNVRLHVVNALAKEGPSEQLATTSSITLLLASEIKLGGSSFASCKPHVLTDGDDGTNCPAKSEVGDGQAEVTVFAGGTSVVGTQVEAFNGPRAKSVLLHIAGSNGTITLDDVIRGSIAGAAEAGFGRKITFAVPPTLRHPGPARATVSKLDITLSGLAKKRRPGRPPKRIPYAGLGPCRDRSLDFRTVTAFEEAAPQAARDQLDCG